MEFETEEFYVKSRQQMFDAMRECTGDEEAIRQALDNTVKIAERCQVEFDLRAPQPAQVRGAGRQGQRHLLPGKVLGGLCKALRRRPAPQECKERLEYELSVIEKMGYVDYYLIVWDFIDYAKRNGIPVGPGRGSGAGSIAAYCIGITGIDPIKYNLLFERFLNPERVSMPDFDIDFCYERRAGGHRLRHSQVRQATASRRSSPSAPWRRAAAVRDVGRVMGMDYQQVDSGGKGRSRWSCT